MSGIYFGDSVRLKSHTAQTKAGKSVIKIELEVHDHFDLASVLRQLDEIAGEQLSRNKPLKTAPTAKPAKQPRLALPAPMKQLPYFPEDE